MKKPNGDAMIRICNLGVRIGTFIFFTLISGGVFMKKEILKVEHLQKSYGSKGYSIPVLNEISFTIRQGDFVAIMGPSGSGKTTLLNMISTIDRPTRGTIWLDGQDITRLDAKALSKLRKEAIGFVFQDYSLLDAMTLFDNIVLPLSLNGAKASTAMKKGKALADQFGLSTHLNKYPYQLSGGQKQRGATCRALIMDPAILFADEPTGALDSKASRDLLECFTQINAENDTTIVMVTHDAFAASYAKEVYVLKDGKIELHIHKGESQKEFFDRILDIQAAMGRDLQ